MCESSCPALRRSGASWRPPSGSPTRTPPGKPSTARRAWPRFRSRQNRTKKTIFFPCDCSLIPTVYGWTSLELDLSLTCCRPNHHSLESIYRVTVKRFPTVHSPRDIIGISHFISKIHRVGFRLIRLIRESITVLRPWKQTILQTRLG